MNNAWRRLGPALRQPSGVFGLTLTTTMVIVAVFAPLIAPYNPAAHLDIGALTTPSLAHILGTDEFGRDLFSRIVYGARASLIVGLVAVPIGALIGGAFGLAAGYLGGRFDQAIVRTADLMFAFPALLLGIGVAALRGPGLENVAIAVAIFNIPIFARVVRSATFQVRHRELIEAAIVHGASTWRILRVHVIPHTLGPASIQFGVSVSAAVLLEAGLSFLGLGAQPPTPSWGNLLSDAQRFLRQMPIYGIAPGLVLTSFVLGVNMLADSLRDAIDPR